MPEAPDLIIPLRIDASKAIGGLSAAGTKAGDAVATGAGKAKKGLDGAEGGADKFGSSLASLMKAQIGLGLIKQTAAAIGSAFNDTAKYVQEMAKEFQGLRKTMQEVATLKGVGNTNKFTVEEAKKAQSFHLSPQEFRDFQTEFQNYAGSQIGTDEKTGQIAEGAKLTTKQGEEYSGRVAELMKGSGIDPRIGAELAGSLLKNKKGAQDVDALIKELSTTFQVLEKGRVPLARALPQMSQIMGHGISAEEAAKMFSIMVPVSPGQEGIAIEAGLRAIEDMKAAGTGEDFGIKRGTSQYDSVKAFAENINKRKADLVASGKTQQEAEDELSATLKDRGVAADVRERRGLVAGFGRQGVELGGFERYERIARETPEDFEAVRKKRYEESPQARQDAVDNAQAVDKAEAGERGDALTKFRQIAETELTKGGAFKRLMPQLAAGTAAAYTRRIRCPDDPDQPAGDSPRPSDARRRGAGRRHGAFRQSGPDRRSPPAAPEAARGDRRKHEESERGKDGNRRFADTAAHRSTGRRGREARILMAQNSNIGQVQAWLRGFVDSVNFMRPGNDQSLGHDVANKVVNQIIERSEKQPTGGVDREWEMNADKYAKWKEKRYGIADGPNTRTG